MRPRPIGYAEGQACCKDCEYATKNPWHGGSRWRCRRVLPSRAVGAHKTCPYSKWRKQISASPTT